MQATTFAPQWIEMKRTTLRGRTLAGLFALVLLIAPGAVGNGLVQASAGTWFGTWEVPIDDLGLLGSGAPSVVVKAFSPGMNVVKYLDAAAARGKKVVLYLMDTVDYTTGTVYPSRIKPWVDQVKNHPALLGYLSVKEPSWSGISLTEMRSLYSTYKANDPNHPVIALLGDTPHFGTSANPWSTGVANILWVDWYPVTCTSGYLSGAITNFPKVRSYVAKVTPAVKIWLVTQGHTYTKGNRCAPTNAQLDREVREGLTYLNASGFIFYTWTNPQYQKDYKRNPSLWSHAKSIVAAVHAGTFR
jgi:hypothetical protein